ncbi:hypothetical protein EDL99_09880 [Ornithobacterium rhinotracheale]|uniref:DUF2586 family protein n=1 Tax=Ornithobacterium rhinotracheale TaxID=28251 RepID=UPI00129C6B9E|nr:DUF2586 family protein [Ornithobacterium rhinotracheale]MRJ09165.1 hypothetical protein [Ornithobacterium rhinotracheale]UOH77249.1 DUF2586 family protein [Ornithobacterium rhinotracheale]
MALPKVLFNIAKDGLGRIADAGAKVPALICTGNTVSAKVQLGKSYQIFSITEAKDLGITEEENPFAYEQVKAFYRQAGDGAELWLMLVSDATTMTEMLDKEGNYAPKIIGDAKGEIRVLGVVKKPTGSESLTGGLDQDVQTAVVNGQALAEHFALKYMPFRVIISGNAWNGEVADLTDYTESDYNKVSCLIGAENTDKYAAVGLTLGKITSIPVQRKIHRVKDGNVLDIVAYFTDGTTIDSRADQWDAIDDKGYIFFRTFAGRSGYYFSGDKTLTRATDDFRTLSNGLVMDKAMLIAYDALVEELSEEVLLSADGSIHPAIIKSWQTKVESNLNGGMVEQGELSAVKVFITPKQDVLRSGKVVINIQLLPVGYAELIEVNIGFTTEIKE